MTPPLRADGAGFGASLLPPAGDRAASGGLSQRSSRRRRLALGLAATPSALAGLILFGAAIGPHAVGLLSNSILESLDPAISFALAALGASIGLDVRVRRPREGRMLAAATVEAGITIVAVAAAIAIARALTPNAGSTPWILALMAGICASPSSTTPSAAAEEPPDRATRIGDLDDLLPVIVSAFAIASVHGAGPWPLAILLGQAVGISLVIAIAGWLLMSDTSSPTERRVFAIGALLLLGGSAAHLSVSALAAGFVAGVFWNALGPAMVEYVAADLRYLQHPLIALLLVVAGGRLVLSVDLVGLVLVYVVFRVAGKVLGGHVASRTIVRDLPRDAGWHLIAPGIVGIACAVNTLQAAGSAGWAGTLATIVVGGFLVSELLSLRLPQAAS